MKRSLEGLTSIKLDTESEESLDKPDQFKKTEKLNIENKGKKRKMKKAVPQEDKEPASIYIDSKILRSIRMYAKMENRTISSIFEELCDKFLKSNKVKDQFKDFLQ